MASCVDNIASPSTATDCEHADARTDHRIDSVAYALDGPQGNFKLWKYTVRQPECDEVVVKVAYCGICHSDIHVARSELLKTTYPFVGGHEFVGTVCAVGSEVRDRKIGETVGVGCYVRSCHTCKQCSRGIEQHCPSAVLTFNGSYKNENTYGGYGKYVVVQWKWTLPIPEGMDITRVAPLFCAGITTFSPVDKRNMKRGNLKIGVNGMGGLGHMAVQFASKVNQTNEVYVFSRNHKKEAESKKLGAKGVIVLKEDDHDSEYKACDFVGNFDYIMDTVPSTDKCYDELVSMLAPEGELIILGIPSTGKAASFSVLPMLLGSKVIRCSAVGGLKQMSDMLEFCNKHDVYPMCESVKADQLEEAYKRVISGDVHFRFVIDVGSSYE